jgi:hypothetical protein
MPAVILNCLLLFLIRNLQLSTGLFLVLGNYPV